MATKKSPSPAFPAPANLHVTFGDDSGELDAQWDPVPGADGYQIAVAEGLAGKFAAQGRVAVSKTTLTGLPSGAFCQVRVRAAAKSGKGAWTTPVTRRVP